MSYRGRENAILAPVALSSALQLRTKLVNFDKCQNQALREWFLDVKAKKDEDSALAKIGTLGRIRTNAWRGGVVDGFPTPSGSASLAAQGIQNHPSSKNKGKGTQSIGDKPPEEPLQSFTFQRYNTRELSARTLKLKPGRAHEWNKLESWDEDDDGEASSSFEDDAGIYEYEDQLDDDDLAIETNVLNPQLAKAASPPSKWNSNRVKVVADRSSPTPFTFAPIKPRTLTLAKPPTSAQEFETTPLSPSQPRVIEIATSLSPRTRPTHPNFATSFSPPTQPSHPKFTTSSSNSSSPVSSPSHPSNTSRTIFFSAPPAGQRQRSPTQVSAANATHKESCSSSFSTYSQIPILSQAIGQTPARQPDSRLGPAILLQRNEIRTAIRTQGKEITAAKMYAMSSSPGSSSQAAPADEDGNEDEDEDDIMKLNHPTKSLEDEKVPDELLSQIDEPVAIHDSKNEVAEEEEAMEIEVQEQSEPRNAQALSPWFRSFSQYCQDVEGVWREAPPLRDNLWELG